MLLVLSLVIAGAYLYFSFAHQPLVENALPNQDEMNELEDKEDNQSNVEVKSKITPLLNSSYIVMQIPDDVPNAYIGSNEYAEIQVKLGQEYWESLGHTGTVSESLTVSIGTSTVGGLGRGCSLENYGSKGSSLSSEVVAIDGQNFIKTTGTDSGMNQTNTAERYVQMLNETQCRFIEFSKNQGNASVYDNPEAVSDNNATFSKILTEKKSEIFSNIKIGRPVN